MGQGGATTVTILFTDLVGSTELLQRTGDERAQRIFRAHHDLLKDTVARHGGHAVKWLGDGLMVAFPSAAEAVRCAVSMQQAAGRQYGGERLRIRVGLNVGDALRDEADYFGTPVVIARRLCDAAKGGQIICSAAVPAVLTGREEFRFRDLGPLDLKGIASAVQAFEVPYEAARPGALLARTPFVGRSAEIARLQARFKEAQAGRGGLVAVSGEPGIGKTRLAEEFCESAAFDGALVLWGRCYEGEWSPPYAPFVEALGELLEAGGQIKQTTAEVLQEMSSATSLIAKLAPAVRDVVPNLPEAPRMEPEEERFRLLEAVTQLLAGIAARTPLVLVLDDLHWAGGATVAMLRHLARSAATSPVLVLGTYREAELDRKHPFADALGALPRETNHERIALKGLTADEVGRLLETLAEHDVPPALVGVISAETDGNPFFIREILLHLIDEGKIFQQDGRWTSQLSVAEMGIPEGVRQVIGRRLSRLSEEANRALSQASVLGRNFDFDVLAALTETSEDALLEALDEALQAQLVQEAKGQFGASYRFTHALVQETLYGEMSIARKQRSHQRAGRALETARVGALDPHVGELARHFREGNDAGKAIEYSIAAGEQARGVFAYQEAVAHWEAALELIEETDADRATLARLLERLGDLMLVSGVDFMSGVGYQERSLTLYEEMGQAERVARMHSKLGQSLSSFGPAMNIDRALEHYRAAEASLGAGPEEAPLGYLYIGLASAAGWGVRVDEGLAASRRALEIGKRLGNAGLEAIAQALHGVHLVYAGQLAQGFALMNQAWQMADQIDETTAFFSAWIRGAHMVYLRDPHEAQDWLQRELLKPRTARAPGRRSLLSSWLAHSHIGAGELDEARAIYADIEVELASVPWLVIRSGDWDRPCVLLIAWREEERRRGNRENEVHTTCDLAHIRALRGEPNEAEALLDEALAIAVEGKSPFHEVRVRPEFALLYAGMSLAAKAQPHLTRCRDIFSAGEDWRGLAGRVALAEGAVAAAEGRLEEAEAHFTRAIDTFHRYTLPWDEAEALRYWGSALLRAGESDRGHEKLNAAITIYRKHGAGERWVELVERVKAG